MKFSALKSCLFAFSASVFFFNTYAAPSTPAPQLTAVQLKLAELEKSAHGRLGIAAFDTRTHAVILYHANERFPVTSTHKIIAVADILKQSQKQPSLLTEKVYFKKADLTTYSPATEGHVNKGMTYAQLCAAAITLSDNTALNLILKKLGGPANLTAFARSIGDTAFRLDRYEPDLNTAIPGDLRDTTTPKAMANTIQRLVFGSALSQGQRQQLQTWLEKNTTGNLRIRAGVPVGWIVGDKTGTGDYGSTNDIGFILPPKCAPIILTVYFTQTVQNAPPKDEVIAKATRILLNSFTQSDSCLKNA